MWGGFEIPPLTCARFCWGEEDAEFPVSTSPPPQLLLSLLGWIKRGTKILPLSRDFQRVYFHGTFLLRAKVIWGYLEKAQQYKSIVCLSSLASLPSFLPPFLPFFPSSFSFFLPPCKISCNNGLGYDNLEGKKAKFNAIVCFHSPPPPRTLLLPVRDW